jgi:low affinity Fe/Cu permease
MRDIKAAQSRLEDAVSELESAKDELDGVTDKDAEKVSEALNYVEAVPEHLEEVKRLLS